MIGVISKLIGPFKAVAFAIGRAERPLKAFEELCERILEKFSEFL